MKVCRSLSPAFAARDLLTVQPGPLMAAAEFDPAAILATLDRHRVDYAVVGGLAGLAHGSRYPTADTDVAYGRERVNAERLAAAPAELGATLRGVPAAFRSYSTRRPCERGEDAATHPETPP